MNGKTLGLWMLTLGFLWLVPLNIRAADGAEAQAGGADRTSIEALRREVETLKQTVNRLEELISEMEANPSRSDASQEHPTQMPVGMTGAETRPPFKGATEPAPAAAAEPSAFHDSGSSSANTPAPAEQAERPSASAVAAPTPGDTGNAVPSVPQQWRNIERRMSAEQVESLLGAPQQKFSVAGKTVWYYQYPDNKRGSVTFSEGMQVSGWQKPPFGGF